MADLWQDALDRALSRHDTRMKGLQRSMQLTYRTLENSIADLARIKDALEAELEKSSKEIRKIGSWKNDPAVFVRSYNKTTIMAYHGSLRCGKAGSRRMKKMLLGQAEAVGLRPCISCGHLAVRSETQDFAA